MRLFILHFKINSTPKSQKKENATKTPSHQDSQKVYFQFLIFCASLCFRVFVAKKYLSE